MWFYPLRLTIVILDKKSFATKEIVLLNARNNDKHVSVVSYKIKRNTKTSRPNISLITSRKEAVFHLIITYQFIGLSSTPRRM